MSPILLTFTAIALVSAVSLIGVFTLSLQEERLRKSVFILVALAAGALLGDALIHLIPEAFEESAAPLVTSLAIILGVLSFFILEKFLRWHHSHGDTEFAENHAHIHPVGHLVLVSDGVHNFIDGVIIGGAFLISPALGIATTVAIMLHEIPQEIGDFGLLISAGFSRRKALLVNALSACTAFLGGIAAFWISSFTELAVPLIAAFAAGNFIYIAGSDIVPELHKTVGIRKSLVQVFMLMLGIGIMILLTFFEGPGH